jgi:hypothetical protein
MLTNKSIPSIVRKNSERIHKKKPKKIPQNPDEFQKRPKIPPKNFQNNPQKIPEYSKKNSRITKNSRIFKKSPRF